MRLLAFDTRTTMKCSTRTTTNVFKSMTALVAVVLLTAACGTVGEGGTLRLSDQSTQQPGALRPLAAGSVGHYCIEKSAAVRGCIPVATAESGDKAVMTVEVKDEKEIYIDALTAGKATLNVETHDGETDSFDIDVRPVKNAIMSMTTLHNNSKHQHGTLPVTSSLNIPVGEFIDADLSYLVGEGGQALTGVPESIAFGEPTTTGSFKSTLGDGGIKWLFESRAEGDTFEVETPYGAPWKVRGTDQLVAADFIASTGAAWRPGELTQKDNTIYAPEGATIFLRFFPVDTDGYVYVGSYDYKAELRVENAELFSPELRSGYDSTDTKNTCVDPIVEGQSKLCGKWTQMEQLRIQMHTPREATQTTIHLKLGDYEKSFILSVEGKSSTSNE